VNVAAPGTAVADAFNARGDLDIGLPDSVVGSLSSLVRAAGERKRQIYLTALANPTLPLIRFEMSDQVELLDRLCSCGSAHRLIADVEGRIDDVFAYEGGVLVHPHVFRSALSRDRAILEYRVCQTATGADVLSVGAPADAHAIERAIAEQLQRLGVRNPVVTVRAVHQLERQDTGKMRRFVPRALKGGP
jgi:phenylacetate-coenzyme A ligase PaaK-like adenylate-forming protein